MNALIHQNAQHNKPNVLVINSKMDYYSGTPEQIKAMSAINSVSDLKKRTRIPILFRRLPHSKSFQLFVDKESVVLSSNFLNKDESGRTISFSFYCDSKNNPTRAKNLLRDYCGLADMSLTPGDDVLFEKCLYYNKHLNKYVIVTLVILLAIITIVIL